MSARVHPHAHPDHLRKQAKDLLRAARRGDADATARLRAFLTKFADSPPSDVGLQEAQFIIAREHGFENWSDLLEEIDAGSADPFSAAVRRVHRDLTAGVRRIYAVALQRQIEVSLQMQETTIADYVASFGPTCWSYRFQFGRRPGAHLAFSLPLCAAILEPQADPEEIQQKVAAILAHPVDPDWAENESCWASDNEFRVLAQSVKAMAWEIESAWDVPPENQITDIVLETVPALVAHDTDATPALRATYSIEAGELEGLVLDVCYSRSTIEPAVARLEA